MRKYLVGLVIAVAVVASAGPAAAGGWWSSTGLDQPSVAVGQRLTLERQTFFTTVDQAETADGTPYYAYLVRGFDRTLLRRAMTRAEPAQWWALTDDAEVVRVGNVRFGRANANLVRTQIQIRIPRMRPGAYHLMLCDAGCVNPLSSTVPTPVQVVADPTVARTAAKVAGLEDQVSSLEQRLNVDLAGEVRSELRGAASNAEKAEISAIEALRQMDELAARVAELEQPPPAALPWAWLVAGLSAVIAAFALGWRGGRAGAAPPDTGGRDDSEWERPASLVRSGRS